MSIKNDILQAIARTDDQNMKTVLLLMLGIIEEISQKLDEINKNDTALREAVLNGHTEQHDSHHDWVAKKIREEEETDKDRKKAIYDLAGKVIFGIIIFVAGAVFNGITL